MDALRIALAVIGVIVVIAVYLTARRQPSAKLQHSRPEGRIEPVLEGEPPSPAEADATPAPAQAATTARTGAERRPPSELVEPAGSSAAPPEEKVISLRIIGRDTADFAAEDAILALREAGLQHGRFGIFHRLHDSDDADSDTVFAAANLVEPGSFDLRNLRDQRLPGLSFFMLRPGPGRGVDAYDRMVEVARSIAITLEGDLLDGDGNPFSIQRERFLRDELIQYELKHLNL